MTDLHDLSASDLTQAYRARRLSPVETTRAALARVEAWEGKINAMYILDDDGALEQAEASEARWRAGTPLSALDGLAVTIKDNIAVKGMQTPNGSAAGDMTPSAADAPPVARLREAGCVLLGKTTMPDFGMLVSGVSSLHGITRNPWNLARNPGGSSAGAAAGIVAGYCTLALGTDIAGSVRLPAAYNGIFALKPSLGRIPIAPPYQGRVNGPITRTVQDAALALTVLTKPDARDFMALPYQEVDWVGLLDGEVRGKKLGLVLDIGVGLAPQPAVGEAVAAAAKTFAQVGAIVEPVAPFISRDMLDGLDRFFRARALAEIQGWPPQRLAKALPFILAWCRGAEGLSAVDGARAFAQIMLMREKTVAAIQGFDFLLTPTSPITAYAADEASPGNDPQRTWEHAAFTAPFNISEQPAASICTGYDAEGLPIGLQIVGHRFDDLGVLRMARVYESLRPKLRPWPQP
jgi:aspartyl-tRNA(Asn)/glutamyl-tRNA(Gln) amidotransferase subunit A